MKYKEGEIIITNRNKELSSEAKNQLFKIRKVRTDSEYSYDVIGVNNKLFGLIKEEWIKGFGMNKNGANK